MYDTIIIGSGLGGLSAGLNLALNKKKVLILEKNSIPGGHTNTIKKGRFEFDTNLFEIYNLDKDFLKKFNINLDIINIPFNHYIMDNDRSFEINGNVDDFLLELEELKKNSFDSLKNLLRIVKEIHNEYNNLKNKKDVTKNELFMRCIDMNTIDILKEINIPKETIDNLSFIWLTIGSPLHKLNFIDFAEFLYNYIYNKKEIIINKNIDVILKMVKAYEDLGGTIYYRSPVLKINKLNNEYEIITNNKTYLTKNIICDVSKNYILSLLNNVNEKDIKIENARTSSLSEFNIYLGLKSDFETIGLNNYHYYHFDTLNSEINYKFMSNLHHHTWEAYVPNQINENASPKNTTILVLKKYFKKNAFKNINNHNYYETINSIADNIIHSFERSTNILITPYIEEIEIVSPIDIKRETNNINGGTKGYMNLGYDNPIHRIISSDIEEIPNLYFVGSSSIFGNLETIYSGIYYANKILGDKNE